MAVFYESSLDHVPLKPVPTFQLASALILLSCSCKKLAHFLRKHQVSAELIHSGLTKI
jgi:hypothetical protein